MSCLSVAGKRFRNACAIDLARFLNAGQHALACQVNAKTKVRTNGSCIGLSGEDKNQCKN